MSGRQLKLRVGLIELPELDTTTFSFGYAAGYDALHPALSENDRATIAEEMVRLRALPLLNDWVLPGKRIHSLDSMGHNWWGVCVAGGGLCALALLGDDPRAQEWIDAVDAGFVQWFQYPGNVLQNGLRTFEHEGPSYEGVGIRITEYLSICVIDSPGGILFRSGSRLVSSPWSTSSVEPSASTPSRIGAFLNALSEAVHRRHTERSFPCRANPA